ncbi:hypothetical protein BDW02DRAFT_609540 [Decorospora gaudefroyi]|uniref:Uncharacterized protein n=1 Tax=Decorospora gaudefroyi TaxID=184978 RepID=A0A6A5K6N0_9PLEO|nr:hypothetical protein BDW02DRAFT_609540 [Decorospora gaudefroyi]
MFPSRNQPTLALNTPVHQAGVVGRPSNSAPFSNGTVGNPIIIDEYDLTPVDPHQPSGYSARAFSNIPSNNRDSLGEASSAPIHQPAATNALNKDLIVPVPAYTTRWPTPEDSDEARDSGLIRDEVWPQTDNKPSDEQMVALRLQHDDYKDVDYNEADYELLIKTVISEQAFRLNGLLMKFLPPQMEKRKVKNELSKKSRPSAEERLVVRWCKKPPQNEFRFWDTPEMIEILRPFAETGRNLSIYDIVTLIGQVQRCIDRDAELQITVPGSVQATSGRTRNPRQSNTAQPTSSAAPSHPLGSRHPAPPPNVSTQATMPFAPNDQSTNYQQFPQQPQLPVPGPSRGLNARPTLPLQPSAGPQVGGARLGAQSGIPNLPSAQKMQQQQPPRRRFEVWRDQPQLPPAAPQNVNATGPNPAAIVGPRKVLDITNIPRGAQELERKYAYWPRSRANGGHGRGENERPDQGASQRRPVENTPRIPVQYQPRQPFQNNFVPRVQADQPAAVVQYPAFPPTVVPQPRAAAQQPPQAGGPEKRKAGDDLQQPDTQRRKTSSNDDSVADVLQDIDDMFQSANEEFSKNMSEWCDEATSTSPSIVIEDIDGNDETVETAQQNPVQHNSDDNVLILPPADPGFLANLRAQSSNAEGGIQASRQVVNAVPSQVGEGIRHGMQRGTFEAQHFLPSNPRQYANILGQYRANVPDTSRPQQTQYVPLPEQPDVEGLNSSLNALLTPPEQMSQFLRGYPDPPPYILSELTRCIRFARSDAQRNVDWRLHPAHIYDIMQRTNTFGLEILVSRIEVAVSSPATREELELTMAIRAAHILYGIDPTMFVAADITNIMAYLDGDLPTAVVLLQDDDDNHLEDFVAKIQEKFRANYPDFESSNLAEWQALLDREDSATLRDVATKVSLEKVEKTPEQLEMMLVRDLAPLQGDNANGQNEVSNIDGSNVQGGQAAENHPENQTGGWQKFHPDALAAEPFPEFEMTGALPAVDFSELGFPDLQNDLLQNPAATAPTASSGNHVTPFDPSPFPAFETTGALPAQDFSDLGFPDLLNDVFPAAPAPTVASDDGMSLFDWSLLDSGDPAADNDEDEEL